MNAVRKEIMGGGKEWLTMFAGIAPARLHRHGLRLGLAIASLSHR
jgi:hypothetical protein